MKNVKISSYSTYLHIQYVLAYTCIYKYMNYIQAYTTICLYILRSKWGVQHIYDKYAEYGR